MITATQLVNYSGTTRIVKPSTLQSWIDKGWYQQRIDAGYTYAIGCGRFVIGKCKCSKCQRPNGGWERKKILQNNKLLSE
jgi:hypothetical protein